MIDIGKLTPCPFCGGEAEVERRGTGRYSTICRCTECGCSLETGETFDHGSTWNSRPYLDEIAARDKRIAGLRELLRALVEEIDDALLAAFFVGCSDCPQCMEDPAAPVTVCPYHAAKGAGGG